MPKLPMTEEQLTENWKETARRYAQNSDYWEERARAAEEQSGKYPFLWPCHMLLGDIGDVLGMHIPLITEQKFSQYNGRIQFVRDLIHEIRKFANEG